ncbi:MAG TPA: hypothetical protein VNC84_01070 [Gammaproteobacteria bacterium]|jgi:hypothetical protein|nr:hypothetical protein [Gammaproteobacteria bacterium]
MPRTLDEAENGEQMDTRTKGRPRTLEDISRSAASAAKLFHGDGDESRLKRAADSFRDVRSQQLATLSVARYPCTALFRFPQELLREVTPSPYCKSAKHLLKCVLQVNESNILFIFETARIYPELFFVSATAEDCVVDLNGRRRTIEDWSPYQAMFGTNDWALLERLEPYLDPYLDQVPCGRNMAMKQVSAKFPSGFDFPPCTDEFLLLLGQLADAITNDLSLSRCWENPGLNTKALLTALRECLAPGVVRSGHHFNWNNLAHAYDLYTQRRSGWNVGKRAFYSIFIIGFLQRFATAPHLQTMWTNLRGCLDDPALRLQRVCCGENDDGEHMGRPFHPLNQLGTEFSISLLCREFSQVVQQVAVPRGMLPVPRRYGLLITEQLAARYPCDPTERPSANP